MGQCLLDPQERRGFLWLLGDHAVDSGVGVRAELIANRQPDRVYPELGVLVYGILLGRGGPVSKTPEPGFGVGALRMLEIAPFSVTE